MTALANGDFETSGGSPGVAASWTWSTSVAAAKIASYGATRFERFELGWGCDLFVSSLVVPTNANTMLFGIPVEQHAFDDFERQWSHNENFVDTLSSAESAEYGTPPQALDGFEREWSSNEHFSFVLGGTVIAIYTGTSTAFDGFEGFWKSNESYLYALASVAAATFTEGGVSGVSETFESVLGDQIFSTNPGLSVFTAPAHGFSNGDLVRVYNDGTGQLPTGLSMNLDYTIGSVTTNTFELLIGSMQQLVADVGAGSNYVKASPIKFWTTVL